MTQDFIYLIKVEPGANNNKFYQMKANSDGTFTATYGRIGANKPAVEIYSISRWDEKYKEKTSKRKDYKDHTHLFTEIKQKSTGTANVVSNDTDVANLIIALQNFAKAQTAMTYLVEANNVTQAQIDAAQKSIDLLTYSLNRHFAKGFNISSFNHELVNLYMVIPRKMKNVSDHLITANTTKQQIQELVEQEQSNLDSMASQVISNVADDEATDENISLVEALGLNISLVTDKKELELIKKHAQNHVHRIKKVYKVVNKTTQQAFDKCLSGASNKKTELLWHGSRNQNWWWIIQQGLKIRPSGAVHSGSMFGDGIYAASESDKSMGYTDGGRWAGGGRNNSIFMALYDFHLGNQKIITSHSSTCYNLSSSSVNDKGYDSVWAKKGSSLYRDEYIVYKSCQCTIKYLIEFSN